MKIKKENKAFAMYNGLLYINMLKKEIDYKIIPKELRTQFNNVHRYGGRRRWFPYKNLELACWSEYTTFVLI